MQTLIITVAEFDAATSLISLSAAMAYAGAALQYTTHGGNGDNCLCQ